MIVTPGSLGKDRHNRTAAINAAATIKAAAAVNGRVSLRMGLRRLFEALLGTQRALSSAGDSLDCPPDALGAGRFTMSTPFRKIDGLKLSEAQWRFGSVERERNQLARIPPVSGLISHPRGLNGVRRPQHQDRVAVPQRFLDLGGEARSATNVVLDAPDVVSLAFQPLPEALCLRRVLARIAEEKNGHAAPERSRAALLSEDRASANPPHDWFASSRAQPTRQIGMLVRRASTRLGHL